MEKVLDEEREYYSLIKKVFRILAPIYDFGTMPISGVRDKTVDFTNAGKGSKILDVATADLLFTTLLRFMKKNIIQNS